jgi:hypothetical protein
MAGYATASQHGRAALSRGRYDEAAQHSADRISLLPRYCRCR